MRATATRVPSGSRRLTRCLRRSMGERRLGIGGEARARAPCERKTSGPKELRCAFERVRHRAAHREELASGRDHRASHFCTSRDLRVRHFCDDSVCVASVGEKSADGLVCNVEEVHSAILSHCRFCNARTRRKWPERRKSFPICAQGVVSRAELRFVSQSLTLASRTVRYAKDHLEKNSACLAMRAKQARFVRTPHRSRCHGLR